MADDQLLPSRPMRLAASEIGALGFASVLFTVAAIGVGGADVDAQLALVDTMARRIEEHIGWAFGVEIPALLGFYAIVIGGQVIASAETAAKIRRRLGFVAEAMAATLLPALLLLIFGALRDPSRGGVLALAIPAAGVLFFLAVQLGGFVVKEKSLRRASAESSIAWAAKRLPRLRRRSRYPVWLVGMANIIAAATLGAFVVAFAGHPVLVPVDYVAVLMVFTVTIAMVVGFCLESFRSGRDRLTRGAGVVLMGSFLLTVAFSVMAMAANGAPRSAAGLGAIVLIIIVSSFAPRSHRRGWRWLRDWSVNGAATRLAAQSVTRTRIKASRELAAIIDGDRVPAGSWPG